MLELLGVQVQEVEDAVYQILTDTVLETAEGAQLDGLGEIVGEERAGRDDATYRIAIRTRIAINLSEGTIENIMLNQVAPIGTGAFRLVGSIPRGPEKTAKKAAKPKKKAAAKKK